MDKRICLVIHSLSPGGMERVMSELATFFSTLQLTEVHLILYGRNRENFYKVSESVILHKPDFHFNNNLRVLSTAKTTLYLRKKVKDIQPDALLSFGETWNIFVLFSLLGLSYRIFISDRAKPGKHRSYIFKKLRSWLYPTAAAIIVQTKKAKKIYEKEFPDLKVVSIPNPIYQIKSSQKSDRENTILFVGRLIPTKHIDRLIKMFSEINADSWKLEIVGGDHGKQKLSVELNELVEELGMREKISLKGVQPDIEKYYTTSKIFAFPSSSEGFPNVVGEALSAGLPVVAYDCVAGPSEMIDDGENGFLIPVHDEVMFKEKLEYLMLHEEKRREMGRKARESVKKFQIEKIGEKFYETITKIE